MAGTALMTRPDGEDGLLHPPRTNGEGGTPEHAVYRNASGHFDNRRCSSRAAAAAARSRGGTTANDETTKRAPHGRGRHRAYQIHLRETQIPCDHHEQRASLARNESGNVIVAPVCYAIEQPTPQLAMMAARCFHGESRGPMPQNWVWGQRMVVVPATGAPNAIATHRHTHTHVDDNGSTGKGNVFHFYRSRGCELKIHPGGYRKTTSSSLGGESIGDDGDDADEHDFEFYRSIASDMDPNLAAEQLRTTSGNDAPGNGKGSDNQPRAASATQQRVEDSRNESIGGAVEDVRCSDDDEEDRKCRTDVRSDKHAFAGDEDDPHQEKAVDSALRSSPPARRIDISVRRTSRALGLPSRTKDSPPGEKKRRASLCGHHALYEVTSDSDFSKYRDAVDHRGEEKRRRMLKNDEEAVG